MAAQGRPGRTESRRVSQCRVPSCGDSSRAGCLRRCPRPLSRPALRPRVRSPRRSRGEADGWRPGTPRSIQAFDRSPDSPPTCTSRQCRLSETKRAAAGSTKQLGCPARKRPCRPRSDGIERGSCDGAIPSGAVPCLRTQYLGRRSHCRLQESNSLP